MQVSTRPLHARLGPFFVFPDGSQNHTLLDSDHEPGPLLIDLLYELTLTKDGAVTISAGNEEMQMHFLIAIGMEHLLADERSAQWTSWWPLWRPSPRLPRLTRSSPQMR